MGSFRFTVPGDPVGKGSVRVYNGRAHKDAKTADYMSRVALAAVAAGRPSSPVAGAIAVRIVAFIDRPAKLVPLASARTEQPPMGWLDAPAKPDADNIAKAILDGLVQGGVIVDDKNVVELYVVKRYVACVRAKTSSKDTAWACEAPRVDVDVAWV